MTLAMYGKSRRRRVALTLAALLAVVFAVGAGIARHDNTALATQDSTQLNISSSTCVEGGALFHFVAPHAESGTGGTLTVTYTVDGGAAMTATADEDTSNSSSNAQWNVTLAGAGKIIVTAASAGSLVWEGQGSEANGIDCGDGGSTGGSGTLTVTKHVVNDDGGALDAGDFNIGVYSGGSAVEMDRGSESGVSYTLDAGSYAVVEGDHPGYTVSYGGDCDASGNVTLSEGGSASCTVTNDDIASTPETGTLTVVKHVINDSNGGSASASDFTLSVTDSGGTVVGSDAGSESGVSYDLAAGTYTVSESANANYTSSFSGDCDASGAVTVVAGGSAVCTLTNDDVQGSELSTGFVEVRKVLTNDTNGEFGDTPFSAMIDSESPFTFSANASSGAMPTTTGSHTVTEVPADGFAQVGWALTQGSVACPAEPTNSGSGPASVDIQENFTTIVCFYNEVQTQTPTNGFIEVRKIVTNDTDDQFGDTEFSATIDGGDPFTFTPNTSTGAMPADVGDHTIAEAPADGFTLQGYAFTQGSVACPAEPTVTDATATVNVPQANWTTIVCVYNEAEAQTPTNGFIEVRKIVTNDTDDQFGDTEFSATIDGGDPFTFTPNTSTGAMPADVGDHTIAEAPADGFTLQGYAFTQGSVACPAEPTVTDATAMVNVPQANWTTIVCVYNEAEQGGGAETGTVTIVKQVDGATPTDGSFDFTATWNAENNPNGTGDFTLGASNNFTTTTSELSLPFDYSLVENGIDGDCDDPGDLYRFVGFEVRPNTEGPSTEAAQMSSTLMLTGQTQSSTVIVHNASCAAAETGTVTIGKFVNGALAESGTFNFDADWGTESGSFTLDEGSGYTITSSPLDIPFDYTLMETNVDDTCSGPDDFRLAGYSSSAVSLEDAAAQAPSDTNSFTDVSGDLFIAVHNVSCETEVVQGQVTVLKQLDGATPTDGSFDFTATWNATNNPNGAGNFTLDASNGFTITSDLLDLPFDYSLVENGIDADCDDPGDLYRLVGFRSGATMEEAEAATDEPTAEFLGVGGNLFIIADNESCAPAATGSITIVKDAGSTETWSADFTTTGGLFENGAEGDEAFTLDQDTSSITFPDLEAGTFTVTEAEMPGWNLISINCTGMPTETPLAPDFSRTVTIALNEGANVVCTFVNQPVPAETGSITLIKDAGDLPGSEFGFTTTGFDTNDPFTLDDDPATALGNTIVFDSLDAGTFSITEDETDGWSLTAITCTGTDEANLTTDIEGRTVSIDLGQDEDVTCTFTNAQASTLTNSITIIKNWTEGTGGEMASFTATGTGVEDFSLTGDDSRTFSDIGEGTYVFTEGDVPGWDIGSITCTGGQNPPAINGSELTLTVGADETGSAIECTFINTPESGTGGETPGTLTVQKVIVGDEVDQDTTNFQATVNGGAPFTFSAATPSAPMEFDAGSSLTVTELALPGWNTTGWDFADSSGVCPDTPANTGATAADVTIDSGADVVICFYNEQVTPPTENTGTLVFSKAIVGEGDATGVTFFATINGGGAIPFSTDGSSEGQVVEAGSYDLVELGTSGWQTVGWSLAASDGTCPAEPANTGDTPWMANDVEVAADATVTVCFYNQAAQDNTGGVQPPPTNGNTGGTGTGGNNVNVPITNPNPSVNAVAGVQAPGAPSAGSGNSVTGGGTPMLFVAGGVAIALGALAYFGLRERRRL